MKKSIWIVLPVVIIAVVLVAVFVGQRNSLSDQVTQLQAERSDLARQLNEADIAAKTAQELAENNRAAMGKRNPRHRKPRIGPKKQRAWRRKPKERRRKPPKPCL